MGVKSRLNALTANGFQSATAAADSDDDSEGELREGFFGSEGAVRGLGNGGGTGLAGLEKNPLIVPAARQSGHCSFQMRSLGEICPENANTLSSAAVMGPDCWLPLV